MDRSTGAFFVVVAKYESGLNAQLTDDRDDHVLCYTNPIHFVVVINQQSPTSSLAREESRRLTGRRWRLDLHREMAAKCVYLCIAIGIFMYYCSSYGHHPHEDRPTATITITIDRIQAACQCDDSQWRLSH